MQIALASFGVMALMLAGCNSTTTDEGTMTDEGTTMDETTDGTTTDMDATTTDVDATGSMDTTK